MPSESDKWGWKHVSVFGEFDKGSGTKKWKCNHCNLQYNGSYSRVRAHLLGFTGVGVKSCPAIDRSLREAFQILEEDLSARKRKRAPGSRKLVSDGKAGRGGRAVKRTRTSQPSITRVCKTVSKEDVDDTVARFCYADGLNFDILNSPYFIDMTKAIAAFGPGYEPPTREKLSDFFLSKEKAKIEKSMTLVRDSWPHTGCSILCVDQLPRTQSGYYANIFASSPRGLIFLKSLDMKDGDGMEKMFVDVLGDAIMEVEPKNVLQIISNLDHANKSFESFILSKFPHLFWSPCTSNSVSVLMEDIAKLESLKPIASCAKGIEECILIYQRTSPCVLIQESSDPLPTKFAPSYCMVKRIVQLKQVLQGVVVTEEWKQWKLTVQEDVLNVETAILGDNFWSKACLFLQFFEPFVKLLSILHIEKSVMGDVFNWRVQALEAVKSNGVDKTLLNQLELLIESKWDMLFSPLHGSGYILNPKYFGKGQAKDKALMRGWKATLDRYESDCVTRRLLREQLSSYWRLKGSFGEEDAVDCRDKMDPVVWWENFGFETPHLQSLAIKILSQVSSISMYQETWQDSEAFRQTAANRLGMERAEDLTFVRNNLILNSRRTGRSSPPSGDKTLEIVSVDQGTANIHNVS